MCLEAHPQHQQRCLSEQDEEYGRMLKAGGAEVDALLRALAQQREEAQAVCAEQLLRLDQSFKQVWLVSWRQMLTGLWWGDL